MLATFGNRLEVRPFKGTEKMVTYDHALRCPVDVWFEKSYKNKYGWVIQFKAASNTLLDEFRADIFKQAVRYVERRVRRPVTEISFEELLELAEALEINQITVH